MTSNKKLGEWRVYNCLSFPTYKVSCLPILLLPPSTTSKMQFLSIISVASLAVDCTAWASDGHGTWVANNKWYDWAPPPGIRQSMWKQPFRLPVPLELRQLRLIEWVHEACTIMNRNDVVYSNGESCACWTNGQGGMFKGSRCIFPSEFFFIFWCTYKLKAFQSPAVGSEGSWSISVGCW